MPITPKRMNTKPNTIITSPAIIIEVSPAFYFFQQELRGENNAYKTYQRANDRKVKQISGFLKRRVNNDDQDDFGRDKAQA